MKSVAFIGSENMDAGGGVEERCVVDNQAADHFSDAGVRSL